MLVVWSALAWAQPACPDQPVETLLGHAEAVVDAFGAMDGTAFERSGDALVNLLPCVDRALEPGEAARLHYAHGLMAFFESDAVASAKSWAALRHIEPGFEVPEGYVPQNHPMRAEVAAEPPPSSPVELDRAPAGGWRVDGAKATAVPDGRAFVLQGMGKGGVPLHTGYHYSSAAVPSLEGVSSSALHTGRRARARVVGTVTASVLLAGAGVFLGLGVDAGNRAKSPDTPVDELDTWRSRNNTYMGVAGGLGGAAVAAGVLTWAVRW